MKKITIKGDNFDPFEIEIKELNLIQREGMFGPSVDIMRLATSMSDDKINELTNDQIFQTAIAISNIVNKKKLKK